jgi:hypothetical protein
MAAAKVSDPGLVTVMVITERAPVLERCRADREESVELLHVLRVHVRLHQEEFMSCVPCRPVRGGALVVALVVVEDVHLYAPSR